MELNAVADCMRQANFSELFIEHLGWDRSEGDCWIEMGGETLVAQQIAHKRGFAVLEYVGPRHHVQVRSFIRDFQARLSRLFHEHLLILRDESGSVQVFAWSFRDAISGRTRQKIHPAFGDRLIPAFLRRLQSLSFGLDEEESITILDVVGRVQSQLDAEPDQKIFFRRPSYARRSDELARAMKAGGVEAERAFLHFHRRLPRSCARRFRRSGQDLDDLTQIAWIGMLRAARHFDPDHGAAFSTYAYRAMLIEFARAREGADRPVHRGVHWMPPLVFERVTAYADLPHVRSADVDSQYSELLDQLRIGLDALPIRESEVIKCRFGIDRNEETLEAIGLRSDVTRERIRQIESHALKRLAERLARHWTGGGPQTPS